jgi:hypothetical protein
LGTPDWVYLPIRAPAHRAIVLPDGTTRELGKEKKMTTSMRTLRNAVLLAVGVMVAMMLVYQSQASAFARSIAIDANRDGGIPTTTTSTSTPTAPSVTQVSPQDGATGVPRNTNIKVTFSEMMDSSTINGSTFQLRFYDVLCIDRYNPCNFSSQLISATVNKDSTDTTGHTYVLDPTLGLYANKRYMVTVTTGVKDSNNSLYLSSPKVWYFTTGSV